MPNFFSNLADAIPLVGTVKGGYHYWRGEKKKGDEAMYQSTRTSAVILGGIFGGPAGAAGAGLATDTAASFLMEEEKGLVNSCKNVVDDISHDRNPTRSILNLGLQAGLDGFSGYSGSGGTGALSKGTGKAMETSMKIGVEQGIQKSVRISSSEAAKFMTRKTTERVATNAAERALLISSHVGLKAVQKTELDEQLEWEERQRLQSKREKEEKKKLKEKERRERQRKEQEQIESLDEYQYEHEYEYEIRGEMEWDRRERERKQWELYQEWRQQEWMEQEQETKRQQEAKRQQQKEKEKQNSKKQQEASKQKQQESPSELASGDWQPPQDNKDDNNDKKKGKNKNKEPTFFEKFMTLLRSILTIVYGKESEPFTDIFKSLPRDSRKYLAKVLKPVTEGTLDLVIELVIRMFKEHFPEDISFLNFLCLLEFVATYVSEELMERTRVSRGTQTADTKMTPEERQEKIIKEISSEKHHVKKLIEIFEKLKSDIEAETDNWNKSFPNFRDAFAAVYHYFKHKKNPDDGRVLSVKEYYDWIRKFLDELRESNKLSKFYDAKDPEDFVHEVFVPKFRRRFKLVLKSHDNKVVLSSAYVVKLMHPDDSEITAIVVAAQIMAVIFVAFALSSITQMVFYNAVLLLVNLPWLITNSIYFTLNLISSIPTFLFNSVVFTLNMIINIPFMIFDSIVFTLNMILSIPQLIFDSIALTLRMLLSIPQLIFNSIVFTLNMILSIPQLIFHTIILTLKMILNIPYFIINTIIFIVKLIFDLFIFSLICLFFILKILFNIGLLFLLVWYLFYHLPDT